MVWMINMWHMFTDVVEGWSIYAVLFRLLFALIVGVIVGVDRGLKRRGAGVKTHVMVCLGSALVMITSEYMTVRFASKIDMARLGAQVISGVGFLGVGTILVTGKNQIRGLTTAAGLWVCACIGLAAGIGFVEGAFLTLLLVMGTFCILTKLDAFVQHFSKMFELYLEFEANKNVSQFLEEMRKRGVKIELVDISREKVPEKVTTAIVSVEMRKCFQGHLNLIDEIREMGFVKYVEEL